MGAYYSKKSWQFFVWLLLFLKKIRLRRALIIIFFSEGQIWALRRSNFQQNSRFCLKIPLKNFRLRRASGPRPLLFKKNPPAAGSYYSKSEKFSSSYYSKKSWQISSGAYYSTLEGGSYYYIPGSCPINLITSRYPQRFSRFPGASTFHPWPTRVVEAIKHNRGDGYHRHCLGARAVPVAVLLPVANLANATHSIRASDLLQ